MKEFRLKKITINENEKLNIFNFDKELNKELKGIYEIYYHKIQIYSNLYANKISFYKEVLLTIDNLNLTKKVKILMIYMKNIDDLLKKIEDKKKFIMKRYEILKEILAKVFEENKKIILGKNNLKVYLQKTNEIVFNLKNEIKNIGDTLRKLNFITENLNIKKVSFLNKENLSGELLRNSYKFTKILHSDFLKFLDIFRKINN